MRYLMFTRYSFIQAIAADKMRLAKEAVERHLETQIAGRLAEINERVG